MATPGYRPGFRAGGPGLADQQRAAKRTSSSEAPPSSDYLRARAELRAQMAKGGSRGSGNAFAPSPEASGDEAEDPNTRVVTVGKISAQFVLPPVSSVPDEKPPEIGAALPHALKRQRKKAEQGRKKPVVAAPAASGTAAVLQAQADRLLEQSSLEARAMAGEFAEGAGRLGLWDRPAAERDACAYVANPTRVPASGAALGRIVGQVQTHNRLLQQDDMWRRHKEARERSTAAASGSAEVSPPPPPPPPQDRAAEILAAREAAVQRKMAARAASEAEAAAAPAPPAVC